MLNKIMFEYNLDVMTAWIAYSALVLSDVKDMIQILAGVVVVSYTLWKWKRDSKNNPPKQ